MARASIYPKNSIKAYHETKKHTVSMFAYNVYPCTNPLDFSFVPMHWQDGVEIIYIKKGTGLVQVDFETYTAVSGDIFFILPGHLHGIRTIAGQRMEYENIIFDLSFLENNSFDLCAQKYWQPLQKRQVTFPVYISSDHELHAAIQNYLDASDILCDQRPTGYELAVKGNLMLVFAQLFQMKAPDMSYKDKDMQKLKMILSQIEEYYKEKLTVSDMAKEYGYSESHFMRWFKEMTGSSFNNYLIEFRLERAASLLKDTSETVLDIAEKSGFDNISNFNRLFKKRFEMTPKEFRKQSR